MVLAGSLVGVTERFKVDADSAAAGSATQCQGAAGSNPATHSKQAPVTQR